MEQPRVLVLSNEAFSYESSNGRTIGGYFTNWPKEKLHQFYTNSSTLDMVDCEYFHLNESDLLRLFRPAGKILHVNQERASENADMRKSVRRSSLTMLLRDAIWICTRFRQERLFRWTKEFRPDIIMVQIGNAPYMFSLAMKLARKTNAKIVVFSTEFYYLLNTNFIDRGKKGLFFHIYKRRYNRLYKKLAHKSKLCIYNTPMLERDFQQALGGKTATLFNSSNLVVDSNRSQSKTIVYAGHLFHNRSQTLTIVADALAKYWPDWQLHVYGAANETIQDAFQKHGAIYLGQAPYQMVIEACQNAGMVLHVEVLDDAEQAEIIKYGFSTKIPDMLSLGKPFLYCAPKGIASTEYLKDNEAAFVCTSKQEIEDFFSANTYESLLARPETNNGLNLSRKNHNPEKNREKMAELLSTAME